MNILRPFSTLIRFSPSTRKNSGSCNVERLRKASVCVKERTAYESSPFPRLMAHFLRCYLKHRRSDNHQPLTFFRANFSCMDDILVTLQEIERIMSLTFRTQGVFSSSLPVTKGSFTESLFEGRPRHHGGDDDGKASWLASSGGERVTSVSRKH